MISTTLKRALNLLGFTIILVSANAQATDLVQTQPNSRLQNTLVLPEGVSGIESVSPSSLAAKELTQPAKGAVVPPTSVVVKPGQTLWRIAVNNTPKGISPLQTLIALYDGNPKAFRNDNIHYLLANSRLVLPTLAQINALTAYQASAFYDLLDSKQSNTKLAAIADHQAMLKKLALQRVQSTQLSQQVQAQQNKLNGLAGKTEQLQAEVKGLQKDRSVALTQQHVMAQTNNKLAQGAAIQEQGIKNLHEERAQLERSMLTLDKQFETTTKDLSQLKLDLQNAQKTLVETNKNLAQGAATQEQSIRALYEEKTQLEHSMLTLDQQFETIQQDLGQAELDLQNAQQALAKTNSSLAQGSAIQEQSIKILYAQRAKLERRMLTLDQQFETTHEELNQAKLDLQSAQQDLERTQQELDLTTVQSVQGAKWLVEAKMWALLLLPLLIIAAAIYWIIWRRKAFVAAREASSKIAEEHAIDPTPLPDYEAKPSAQMNGLSQSSKEMHAGMPEQSFIEELLQPKKDEDQPLQSKAEEQQEVGQAHLSEDIEALLNGQIQTHNQADEPVSYLSHEEEMDTKLDLALSYRDMGELVQAKSVLTEVLHQGNTQQVEQAKALLSSINNA